MCEERKRGLKMGRRQEIKLVRLHKINYIKKFVNIIQSSQISAEINFTHVGNAYRMLTLIYSLEHLVLNLRR